MSNKRNRDILRQNKATSVVAGTIYSYICEDGIKNMGKMSDIVLKEDGQHLSIDNKERLQFISDCSKSSIDSLSIASQQYMRCSTYIRCGAKTIAKKAQNTMKSAILLNEVAKLKKPTSYRLKNNHSHCGLRHHTKVLRILCKKNKKKFHNDAISNIDGDYSRNIKDRLFSII